MMLRRYNIAVVVVAVILEFQGSKVVAYATQLFSVSIEDVPS
jgi:hypothetical protein